MKEVESVLAAESRAEASELVQAESAFGTDVDSIEASGNGVYQLVIRPAAVSLFCAILFLREGWIVGQAGVLGAVLVMLPSFLIMTTSALIVSAVSANSRAGSNTGTNGIAAMLVRGLGYETGATVSLLVYLSHIALTSLFVYAFTEAWQYIFPLHPKLVISLVVLGMLLSGTLLSERLVFRLQDAALILLALAIGSALLGGVFAEDFGSLVQQPHLWGTYDAGGFGLLFAVFFAAAGGILLGVSKPGALRARRRNLPRGLLGAVGGAFVVYFIMAIWYGSAASPADLGSRFLIAVERAAWGPVVLTAILASTLVAGLTALQRVPLTLPPVARQGDVSASRTGRLLATIATPRGAILTAAGLALIILLLGDLNRIAVLASFILILCFLAVHVAVVIDQVYGLSAFRPVQRLPRWIAPVGGLTCIAAMFLVSPIFTVLGIGGVILTFIYLSRSPLPETRECVRSGVSAAVAEWIVRRSNPGSPSHPERAWRPHLLVPVSSRSQLDGSYRFLRLLAEPRGSIRILGIQPQKPNTAGSRGSVLGMADRDLFGSAARAGDSPEWEPKSGNDEGTADANGANGSNAGDLATLSDTTEIIRNGALRAVSVLIEAPNLVKGVETAARIYRSSAHPPNVLFGFAHLYNQEKMQGLVDAAAESGMGVALFHLHPEMGLRHERIINVWTGDRGPDWAVGLRMEGLDLMLMLAYQLSINMDARLRLSAVHREPHEAARAHAFLDRLVFDARLAEDTERWVAGGSLLEQVESAPQADLHLFSLSHEVHHARLTTLVRHTGSSCLFVRDSGIESALA